MIIDFKLKKVVASYDKLLILAIQREELNYAPSWAVSFMASTTSYFRPPLVAYHLVSVSSSFFLQILVVLPAHMKAL